MKSLFSFLLALFICAPVFATNNQVVSYQSQVVMAYNPNSYDAQVAANHCNDLVSNLKAGYGNQVSFYAVAEPQHCSVNQVNQYMSNQVKVVVQKNALVNNGFTGYNQSVAQCVRVVKVQNKVVQRRVVRRVRLFGFLTGNNARQVKVVVQNCRG